MIPGKNYNQIRYTLLFQSLTLTILSKELRRFYKIPPNGEITKHNSIAGVYAAKDQWLWKRYGSAEDYRNNINRGLRAMHQIADKIVVDRSTFEDFILFGVTASYKNDEYMRIIGGYDLPSNEPGIYIKITPTTTGPDLLRIYNELKPHMANYFKHLGVKMRKKSTGKNPKKDIQIYQLIEDKIKEYYNNRLSAQVSKNKTKTEKDIIKGEEYKARMEKYKHKVKDYENIIDDAIRELASDEVPYDIDDKEWQMEVDKKTLQLKVKYYDITERYNLPTLRDLSSMLRLIPNN